MDFILECDGTPKLGIEHLATGRVMAQVTLHLLMGPLQEHSE